MRVRDAARMAELESRTRPVASRWQKVVGILGLVVVVWVGSETYDVVVGDFGGPGPGGHGQNVPGQEAPVEDQDQEPDTDDGGGHRPPTGRHG